MTSWLFPRPEKVLFWAFLGMVILIGGCCSPGPVRPLRPWYPPCDPTHCADGCWEGGVCGGGPAGQAGGSSEADLACQGCLPTPPPPPRWYPGPLSWLFDRLVWPYYPGFAGCGERYWSPWAADPPDCCDPCDRYGQWNGAQRGSGYSSMYPNVFPGPIYSEAPLQTEPVPGSGIGPAPGAKLPVRPNCPECGRGYQAGFGRMPPAWPLPELPDPLGLTQTRLGPNQSFLSPKQGVCPAGYSNLAQRPSQPYRDPITR